jgi:hypothetical protein
MQGSQLASLASLCAPLCRGHQHHLHILVGARSTAAVAMQSTGKIFGCPFSAYLGFVCLHYLQAAKVKILMHIVCQLVGWCTANSSTNTHVWHFPSQKQIPLAQGTYHPIHKTVSIVYSSLSFHIYALFCFICY